MEQASTVRNVDMLESRETWRSIDDSVQRKNRHEETKDKEAKYTEIKSDVTKISSKVLTPIEDKLRTIRDPEAIDLENLDWEFSYARNAELNAVIEAGMAKGHDGTNKRAGLGDIRTPAGSFHSTDNVANRISKAIKTFRMRNRQPINVTI